MNRFPQSQLTCVEGSGRMLARARQRTAGSLTPITWIHSDFFHWMPVPDEKYDALVTCFFLDCFSPPMLAEAVEKLACCAAPDAVWIVVDFAVPPRGPARWRAKVVHALMYTFFRLFTSLPARKQTEPDNLLRMQGFQLEARKEFEWGLIRADVWRRGIEVPAFRKVFQAPFPQQTVPPSTGSFTLVDGVIAPDSPGRAIQLA